MDFFSLKRDRGLTIMTFGFIAWIVVLLMLMIFSSRDVFFFDGLAQTDVSSQYSSILPMNRYLLEPIIGITFLLRSVVDGIFALFLIYAVVRILYIILNEKYFSKSTKFNLLALTGRRFSNVVSITALLIVLGIIGTLAMGILTEGFLFLSNYFMRTIQMYFTIGLVIICAVFIYILMKLIIPRLRFDFTVTHPKAMTGKIFLRIGKELKYTLCFLMIVVSFGLLLISTHFPTHQIVTNLENGEYLIDFHVHTYYSDGFLTPQERVDWYITQGIHAAFFTDHETQRGAYLAQQYVEQNNLSFTVLIGQEYTSTTPDIHLNIFGLNHTIVPEEYATPGGPLALNVSDMIKYVKSKGAFVVVNHYHRYGSAPYTYEELRDWGVDGFEIINDGMEYPSEIREFCLNHTGQLAAIAGSDIHTNQELHTVTKINLTDPTNITHIFEELKKNEHQAILIDLYPKKIHLPYIAGLSDPFENLINYFLNLDQLQLLSWIIWSAGGFFVFLITYKLIERANVQSLKQKILKGQK